MLFKPSPLLVAGRIETIVMGTFLRWKLVTVRPVPWKCDFFPSRLYFERTVPGVLFPTFEKKGNSTQQIQSNAKRKAQQSTIISVAKNFLQMGKTNICPCAHTYPHHFFSPGNIPLSPHLTFATFRPWRTIFRQVKAFFWKKTSFGNKSCSGSSMMFLVWFSTGALFFLQKPSNKQHPLLVPAKCINTEFFSHIQK